jgi:molybdopterin-guanine dinucleotide biosynthesis protein A
MAAVAGIVLAGGRSTRMGTPKAALEWHGSTLLRRVTGIVARAVDGPVLVVRAPEQALPALPSDVRLVDDPREGLGPLQGLAAGLAGAAAAGVSIAFVCATDLPFLHPAFVRRVLRGLHADADMALPVVDGRPQPLAAAYRTALAPAVARWVADGERRLTIVAERTRPNALDVADLLADGALAAADPRLDSLANVNTVDAYRAARARPAPRITVRRRDASMGGAGTSAGGAYGVRAATLAGAAAAIGLSSDGPILARLDGATVSDGTTPLVTGDDVTFLRVE